MTQKEFYDLFPKLYHMTDRDALKSIKKHGLLSVKALLDLFEVKQPLHGKLISSHRPEIAPISHPLHGVAKLRDQKPMSDSALAKCLNEMSAKEWYELLNKRSFFWVDYQRVQRLLNARAYRGTDQLILTFDTKAVLAQYFDKVELCPINSGSTIFKPQPRGRNTFAPFDKYDFAGWTEKRGSIQKAVVEFTILGGLPDASKYLLKSEIVSA